jgi:hypothetical protein
MGGEERKMTPEHMWRVADGLRGEAAQLEDDGWATVAKFLRDGARAMDAQAWAEVTG